MYTQRSAIARHLQILFFVLIEHVRNFWLAEFCRRAGVEWMAVSEKYPFMWTITFLQFFSKYVTWRLKTIRLNYPYIGHQHSFGNKLRRGYRIPRNSAWSKVLTALYKVYLFLVEKVDSRKKQKIQCIIECISFALTSTIPSTMALNVSLMKPNETDWYIQKVWKPPGAEWLCVGDSITFSSV
jgi:hypothetical protein